VVSEFAIDAIGIRVVHGGLRFREATVVTDSVLNEIHDLASLAPLHNPPAVNAIESVRRALPYCAVVAVFDTAFHATLPEVAAVYAMPFELCDTHGLRRYGFHGISHRYSSQRLLECLGRSEVGTRLITCHLGNGASVCAIRDGKSIDTSMGLTPMEGLVMGTRSGDVDPGLILHLFRALNMSVASIDDLLNHKSGLLGLSGLSSDVRELEAAASRGGRRAQLALEVFAYRVSKYIGAYAAALEGIDAIAFTGGIGEHSAEMRRRICERLSWMGLSLDLESNRRVGPGATTRICQVDSRIESWVIPANEELQIAREVGAALGLNGDGT
jgi:acetate kinase